jgi:hypothetical protein
MKKTLLASALAIAFGLSGQAMASEGHSGGHSGGSGGGTGQAAEAGAAATVTSHGGPAAAQGSLVNQDSFNETDSRDQSGQNNSDGDAKSYDTAGVAANNGGWATSTLTNAFNTSKAIATSRLHGSVSHNMIMGLGNKASTFGSADGGKAYGGKGGLGIGGSAMSLGAKGGAAEGGEGGNGGDAGVTGVGMGGSGHRDSLARHSGGDSGSGGSQSDGTAGTAGVSGNTGGAGGAGGGTNNGGEGGAGGAATAAAGVGGNAAGGTGGAGGQVYADAGTFNMSNAMWNVGQSAAGIMIATQNSGLSSLVQQSINVQANMSLR